MSAIELLPDCGVGLTPMKLFFTERISATTRPAIFLDRDGVINEKIESGYVTRWGEFRLVPGIIETIAKLSGMNLPIIVVSNQACVAKGLLARSDLAEITTRFVTRLRKSGARIDAVYYCPHRSQQACGCRKPKADLLRHAARDWRLNLDHSVLIGDSMVDVGAARAVGSKAILIDRGIETNRSVKGVITVQSVLAIARH